MAKKKETLHKKRICFSGKRVRCWFGLLAWVGVVFSFVGCVTIRLPRFPRELRLRTARQQPLLRFAYYPQEEAVMPDIVHATVRALQVAQQWGALHQPITIHVFPNHASLEEAVAREYSWLRAWARYQGLYLQSPRTWGTRYYRRLLFELLTHELTHVVMYQLVGSSKDWARKEIPLWFREGMASVTALQGYRRASPRYVRNYIRTHPLEATLWQPDHEALQKKQWMIYSISHWMFVYLLQRHQKKGVQQVLVSLRQGKSFGAAFRQLTAGTVAQFVRAFRRQLDKAPQSLLFQPLLPQGRQSRRLSQKNKQDPKKQAGLSS